LESSFPSSCAACGGQRSTRLFEQSYKAVNLPGHDAPPIHLTFWRCQECRVVFTSHPHGDVSSSLYEEVYSQAALEPPSPLNHARYNQWLDWLESYRSNGKLFESGFGRGGFLRAALARGWTCAGNEVSRTACDLVRPLGADVRYGDLSSVTDVDQYDVLVSLGAIEHTSDPAAQVGHYYRLLRPGGGVFMTTPNFNSLSRHALKGDCRIFDPEHLFYFSPASLGHLLRRTGFQIDACWTQNVNVHEIANRFRRHKAGKQETYDAYQSLRAGLESRAMLRVAKRAGNALIRALGVGEELYIIGRKPAR